MAGISNKALNGAPQNKEKTFQGQQIDDDLGLNLIQFKWRNHDPQIGRFIEIDPLANDYVYNSTYAFSENKVTVHVELEGLEAEYIFDFFKRAYNEVLVPLARTVNQANPLAKLGEIVSAKSIESDFSQPKSRMEATAELGMIFIAPELALEKSAVLSLERGVLNTEVKGATKAILPDDANVVRGGTNTPELIKKGTGTHPEGVRGVSVECGTCPVKDLAKPLPHNKIGVTTVGEIRKAGGDVIVTSGKSPNHATATGITPEALSYLLNPWQPNPNKLK